MKKIIVFYNTSEATIKDIVKAIEAGGDTVDEHVKLTDDEINEILARE